MSITTKYVCKYCHRNFVREHAYMDHECKQMKRENEIKSPNGQAAWHYYQTWMKHKKRMPPPASAFMTSKYFRTFINFAQFVKKVQLPLPDKFIWLMVKRDYPPTMWLNDEVYSQYLDFVDAKMPPIEQAKTSISTILDYADSHDIDVSAVFERINPNELIHLVRLRKLSPWLLLVSKKFAKMYVNLNEEQQTILETLIKPDVWAEKKEKHKQDIDMIKVYVGELGI